MAEDCAPTLRVHSSSSSSNEERRGSGAQLSCRWRRGLELTERWSYKWDHRFGRSSAFVFFLFKRIYLVMHLFSGVKISSRPSLSWKSEVSVIIWKALPPFFKLNSFALNLQGAFSYIWKYNPSSKDNFSYIIDFVSQLPIMCTTGELVKDTSAERVLAASGFEPCHAYISNHETQLLNIVWIL